jgi:hypothetical protein
MGPVIKRFVIEGAAKEVEHLLKKQAHEEMRLKKRMLKEGCVPVLDITPLMYHVYDADKETFRYSITMYGAEVEDAWSYEGWLNGELVTTTMNTKWQRLSAAWV